MNAFTPLDRRGERMLIDMATTYSPDAVLRAARDAYRTPDAPENSFATIESYWRDPAPFEAEQRAGQAQINATFATHEARVRAQMEAMWAEDARATQGDA